MPFRRRIECPIDRSSREWIDRRWHWLCRQFGEDRARRAQVILPRPEFFPEPYAGTVDDADILLCRVARYMALDPSTVTLQLYTEDRPQVEGYHEGSSGLYFVADGLFHICIETRTLEDPAVLVATLAHELARVHLLGHGRLSGEESDHEPLTDLLTVFLGLGVITANAVLRESYWQVAHEAGWSMRRGGYLSMAMYGYALARFVQVRHEDNPLWADELRLDVRSALRLSLRLLANEDQCDVTYAPQLGSPDATPSETRDEPQAETDPRCTFCKALVEGVATEEPLVCPECQESMDESDVDPPDFVYSLRSRRFLLCILVMLLGIVLGFLCLILLTSP